MHFGGPGYGTFELDILKIEEFRLGKKYKNKTPYIPSACPSTF